MRSRLRTLLPDAMGARCRLHTFHSLGLDHTPGTLECRRVAAGLPGCLRSRAAPVAAGRAGDLRAAGPCPPVGHLPRQADGHAIRGRRSSRRRRRPTGAGWNRATGATSTTWSYAPRTPWKPTPKPGRRYGERYPWVCIDEYQDVDEHQVRLIRQIVPPDGNICAIGDPDQAIYGFRGADRRFFSEFTEHFPGARMVRLSRNYRSDRNIVTLSSQVIAPAASAASIRPGARRRPQPRHPPRSPERKAEAEFVVQSLEEILGGHSFFSIDSGRSDRGPGARLLVLRLRRTLPHRGPGCPPWSEALAAFRHAVPAALPRARLLSHPGVAALVATLAPVAGRRHSAPTPRSRLQRR